MRASTKKTGLGFTLLELIASMAIAGVLLGTAVPSLRDTLSNQQLIARKNDLLADLHFARSYAVTHRQRIVMCPSVDGSSCRDTGVWEDGWIVFEDRNANRAYEESETRYRVIGPQDNSITIRTSNSRRNISYRPDGRAPGANLTMTFCDHRGDSRARALILNNAGRIRTANNGPNSRTLTCA